MSDDLFQWAVGREAAVLEKPSAPLARRIEPRLVLRPYQAEHREKTHAHFVGHKAGLGVAATGAGKTVFFSALVQDYHPRRCLILTDQFDLVDQTVERIHETTGLFADVEQGDRRASPNAKIVVATVQSIGTRLEAYPPDHFALVVADECDRAMAPQWQRVIRHFAPADLLGVTATPKRTDKRNLLETFGTKIFEIGLLDLIEQGYLSPVAVQPVPIRIDLSGVQRTAGDLDAGQVGNAIERVFGEVAEAIHTYSEHRKILIFLPTVDTSKKLVGVLNANGITAEHIDGTSPNRQAIKRAFRDRRFQALCNPMLLGRGYDDPSIDCIINLRATQSESLYQQIVGRGTRLYCPNRCPGPCGCEGRKIDLQILDFLWQFKGLGPCRPSCLIADTEEKAKAMDAAQDRSGKAQSLLDLKLAAERDIEAALLRALADAQKVRSKKKGEYFNASQWAANLRLPDLTAFVPESPEEAGAVPGPMMTKLKRAGFIPESITCVGHAAKILAVVEARREAGLASFKQVFWLRKFGYSDPATYTMDEAKRTLTPEFRRRGKF